MKKVILIALVLSSCNQNKDADDNQLRQISIYQMGKLIKVDTAKGWIQQNGYLGTLQYEHIDGSKAVIKGDYIITPLK